MSMTTFSKQRISLFLLLTCWIMLLVPVARANAPADTQGFRKAVTLAGIREHQAALQAIANANGGTRASGTPGFDASATYVADKLTAAGYQVVTQEFPFTFVERTGSGHELSPVQRDLNPLTLTFSPSTPPGGLTAPLAVVPSDATPGCEATDFAGGSYLGTIALIQRGGCNFSVKAANAANAGAIAALIYNNVVGSANPTLGSPAEARIPTAFLTLAIGQALIADTAGGTQLVMVNLVTKFVQEQRTTVNLIAETAGGDPNRVIVIGAHLDSVLAGPGINDNGSGSATVLEVAEVFPAQQREPRNKLRFMWFGAEELGLVGSTYYVNQLSQAEKDRIELNLNFDMIGSPNFVRFVYDGNNSAFPVGPGAAQGPAGSGAIEEVFHTYFASQGLASAETPFSGRSDYGPFIAAGIPAGGLFTGAEGIKTAGQAAIYGGTAGAQLDPCYHQACDTYANNSDAALDQMSDAVAHAVLLFSKWNFDKDLLVDGPPTKGKGNADGGGGLHQDHDHDLQAVVE